MKNKGSRKLAFFFIVPIFLMVGGAAAFFYVLSNVTDPVVEQDINDHFAAIENHSQSANSADLFVKPPKTDPNFVLFSTSSATGSTTKKEKNKKRAKTKKQKKKEPLGFPPKEVKPGITEIAPGTFLIQETAMAEARSNLRKYIGSALAELVNDKTGPIGFQLKNISKRSYLHSLGLRNKDILVAINGHPLNSIENVSLAVASFKYATQFRLDYLRKNKRRSLYYKVVAEK